MNWAKHTAYIAYMFVHVIRQTQNMLQFELYKNYIEVIVS